MKTNKILLSIILLCTFSTFAFSQVIEIKGKIKDAQSNELLVGVIVIEKGTRNSTITDKKGEFKILSEIGKVLEFSYIGYITHKMPVSAKFMEIKMTQSSRSLNECVVIGYGTKKMTMITGAISSSHSNRNTRNSYIVVTDNLSSNFTYVQTESDKEEYGKFKENRFISARNEALSTFSLDVDAASYGNMRRMINQGKIPNKEAIRIEELINYFSYDYPQPTGNDPANIVTETAKCPWNLRHKLVRIGVKAKEIPTENLPVSNFVFLLDVSGSMNSANKLELVKSSIKLLTNNLRDEDRVAIVVYAGAAGVVLPSTSGTDKQKIMEAVNNLQAGGSTAGGAGIELAYKIAEKNFIKNGNNRIILCSDGDFNVGISNPTELEEMIEEKSKTGVYLTVLGYGMGNYKDNKLQVLAQKGNGNHAYIDNIQEANKVLVNEFGSTMYTVAKDVKIQVEFNPAFVNAYRLVGYESRLLNKEDFNDDTKDAGELGSGHTVTALYEIIPVGVENTFGGVDDLKYQKENKVKPTNDNSTELLTVKLRYKTPTGNISEKIEVPVFIKDAKTNPSTDFQFAISVAMFGQLLRDSDFKGNGSYKKVIELANEGLGEDIHGYRREFVRLVESVNQLAK